MQNACVNMCTQSLDSTCMDYYGAPNFLANCVCVYAKVEPFSKCTFHFMLTWDVRTVLEWRWVVGWWWGGGGVVVGLLTAPDTSAIAPAKAWYASSTSSSPDPSRS